MFSTGQGTGLLISALCKNESGPAGYVPPRWPDDASSSEAIRGASSTSTPPHRQASPGRTVREAEDASIPGRGNGVDAHSKLAGQPKSASAEGDAIPRATTKNRSALTHALEGQTQRRSSCVLVQASAYVTVRRRRRKAKNGGQRDQAGRARELRGVIGAAEPSACLRTSSSADVPAGSFIGNESSRSCVTPLSVSSTFPSPSALEMDDSMFTAIPTCASACGCNDYRII